MAELVWWTGSEKTTTESQVKIGDGFQLRMAPALCLSPLEGADHGIQFLHEDTAAQYSELTYFTLEIASTQAPSQLDVENRRLEETVAERSTKESYGSLVYQEERYTLKHIGTWQHISMRLEPDDHCEVLLTDYLGANSTIRMAAFHPGARSALEYGELVSLYFQLEGVNYYLSMSQEKQLTVSAQPTHWTLRKTIDFATDLDAINPHIPVKFNHPELPYSLTLMETVYWYEESGENSRLVLSKPQLGQENYWFLEQLEGTGSISWNTEVYIRNAYTREYFEVSNGELRLSFHAKTPFRLRPVKAQQTEKVSRGTAVVLTYEEYYVAVGRAGLTQQLCDTLSGTPTQDHCLDLVLHRSDLAQYRRGEFIVEVGTLEQTLTYYQLLMDITALKTASSTLTTSPNSLGSTLNRVLKGYLNRLDFKSQRRSSHFLHSINTLGIPLILMMITKQMCSLPAKEQVQHYLHLLGSTVRLLALGSLGCCRLLLRRVDVFLDCYHLSWVADVLSTALQQTRELPRSLTCASLLNTLQRTSIPQVQINSLQLISRLFQLRALFPANLTEINSLLLTNPSFLLYPIENLQVKKGENILKITELSKPDLQLLCQTCKFFNIFARTSEKAANLIKSPPFNQSSDLLIPLILAKNADILLRRAALSLCIALEPEIKGNLACDLRVTSGKREFLGSLYTEIIDELANLQAEYEQKGAIFVALKRLAGLLKLLNLLLSCDYEFDLEPCATQIHSILQGFESFIEGNALTKALQRANFGVSGESVLIRKFLQAKPLRKIVTSLASIQREEETRSTAEMVEDIQEKFQTAFIKGFKQVWEAHVNGKEDFTLTIPVEKRGKGGDWKEVETRKEVEKVIRTWLKDRIEATASSRHYRLVSLSSCIAKSSIKAYFRLTLHYQRLLARVPLDLLTVLRSHTLASQLQLHYRSFWLVAINPLAHTVPRPTLHEVFNEAFDLETAVTRRKIGLKLHDIYPEIYEKTDRILNYAYRFPGIDSNSQAIEALKSLVSFLPLSEMRSNTVVVQKVQKEWLCSGIYRKVMQLLDLQGENMAGLTHYCALFLWLFVLNNDINLQVVSEIIRPKAALFRFPQYAEVCLQLWRMGRQHWEEIYSAVELLSEGNPQVLALLELCFEGDPRGGKVLEQYCFVRALKTQSVLDASYLTALAGTGHSRLSSFNGLNESDICTLLSNPDLELPIAALLVSILHSECGGDLCEATLMALVQLWTKVSIAMEDMQALNLVGLRNCYECVYTAGTEVWLQKQDQPPEVSSALATWSALFSHTFFWRRSGLVLEICRILGQESDDDSVPRVHLRRLVTESLIALEIHIKSIQFLDFTSLQSAIEEARTLLQGEITHLKTTFVEGNGKEMRRHVMVREIMKLDVKQGENVSESDIALHLKSALYASKPALYFTALRLRLEDCQQQAKNVVFKEVGFTLAAESAVVSLAKSVPPETRREALLFLSSLLQYLSPAMVQDFKSMLDHRGLSLFFSKHLHRELNTAIRHLRDQQSLLSDSIETTVLVLTLVQTCCKGCNTPLQDFFRSVSHSDLNLINSCCEVVETVDSESSYELVAAGIDTLRELVAGPNEENQKLVALRPALLRSLSELVAGAVLKETQLLPHCADLLLALLDGGNAQAEITSVVKQHFNVTSIVTYLNNQSESLTSNQSKLELGTSVPCISPKISIMIRLFIFLIRLSAVDSFAQINPAVLSFLRKYTGHVEVMNRGKSEQTYFPLPFDAFFLTDHTKNLLVFEADRNSQQAQLIDFLNSIPALEAEMGYQQRLHRYRLKLITSGWSGYGKVSFLFLLCINVMVVLTFGKEELLGQTSADSHVMTVLGTLQLVFFLLYTVCYIAEYFPRLIRDSKTNFAGLDYDSKEYQQKSESLELTLDAPSAVTNEEITTIDQVKYFCTGKTTVYCLCYITGSVLAMVLLPALYPFLLVDGLHRFEGLHHIFKAITINKWYLSLSLLMVVVVVYQFTLLAFLTIKDDYDPEQNLYCDTLLSCLVTNMDMGARNGGGIGNVLPSPSPSQYWIRLLFDTLFYVVVIVILQNVSFGIIIDTYAELRDQETRLMEDVYESCFVCGVTRGHLELRGESFLSHIQDKHSLFNYICYVVYLKHKHCSGSEAVIKSQILKFDTSFFPLDKEAV